MAAGARGLIHYKQRTTPMFGPDCAEIPLRVRHNPAYKTRWICAASRRGDIQFVVEAQRKERHVRGNHDTKPGGSTAALSCGNPRHRYAARTTRDRPHPANSAIHVILKTTTHDEPGCLAMTRSRDRGTSFDGNCAPERGAIVANGGNRSRWELTDTSSRHRQRVCDQEALAV